MPKLSRDEQVFVLTRVGADGAMASALSGEDLALAMNIRDKSGDAAAKKKVKDLFGQMQKNNKKKVPTAKAGRPTTPPKAGEAVVSTTRPAAAVGSQLSSRVAPTTKKSALGKGKKKKIPSPKGVSEEAAPAAAEVEEEEEEEEAAEPPPATGAAPGASSDSTTPPRPPVDMTSTYNAEMDSPDVPPESRPPPVELWGPNSFVPAPAHSLPPPPPEHALPEPSPGLHPEPVMWAMIEPEPEPEEEVPVKDPLLETATFAVEAVHSAATAAPAVETATDDAISTSAAPPQAQSPAAPVDMTATYNAGMDSPEPPAEDTALEDPSPLPVFRPRLEPAPAPATAPAPADESDRDTSMRYSAAFSSRAC